jgi:predicted O-methyltransferase YrrM
MREPWSEVTEEFELWSCQDIDSTEDEVIELLGSLVRAMKPRLCVEVGSHVGLSSLEMGRALERNGRGHLHCFESVPESAGAAQERTAGLPVTVHAMTDLSFDPSELPGPVDFLFVDGDLDNRGDSMRHWRDSLSDRHVVAVHDSLKHWEVRESIESVGFAERLDVVTPRGITLLRL